MISPARMRSPSFRRHDERFPLSMVGDSAGQSARCGRHTAWSVAHSLQHPCYAHTTNSSLKRGEGTHQEVPRPRAAGTTLKSAWRSRVRRCDARGRQSGERGEASSGSTASERLPRLGCGGQRRMNEMNCVMMWGVIDTRQKKSHINASKNLNCEVLLSIISSQAASHWRGPTKAMVVLRLHRSMRPCVHASISLAFSSLNVCLSSGKSARTAPGRTQTPEHPQRHSPNHNHSASGRTFRSWHRYSHTPTGHRTDL